MGLDYELIGKRIAKRRRQLRMKQYEVEEKADIGYKYLTNIERAISIPSTEVITSEKKARNNAVSMVK